MVFRHAYDGVKSSVGSPVGDRYYREGKVVFDPDGNMHLEHGKERDRFAEIQSYKDSCDVNNIIKRYENGDQSALLRSNSGVYCDITSVPRNIHEAVKLSRSVESVYNNLDIELKNLYPSLSDFTAAFSDKSNFASFVSHCKSIKDKRDSVEASKEVPADA